MNTSVLAGQYFLRRYCLIFFDPVNIGKKYVFKKKKKNTRTDRITVANDTDIELFDLITSFENVGCSYYMIRLFHEFPQKVMPVGNWKISTKAKTVGAYKALRLDLAV